MYEYLLKRSGKRFNFDQKNFRKGSSIQFASNDYPWGRKNFSGEGDSKEETKKETDLKEASLLENKGKLASKKIQEIVGKKEVSSNKGTNSDKESEEDLSKEINQGIKDAISGNGGSPDNGKVPDRKSQKDVIESLRKTDNSEESMQSKNQTDLGKENSEPSGNGPIGENTSDKSGTKGNAGAEDIINNLNRGSGGKDPKQSDQTKRDPNYVDGGKIDLGDGKGTATYTGTKTDVRTTENKSDTNPGMPGKDADAKDWINYFKTDRKELNSTGDKDADAIMRLLGGNKRVQRLGEHLRNLETRYKDLDEVYQKTQKAYDQAQKDYDSKSWLSRAFSWQYMPGSDKWKLRQAQNRYNRAAAERNTVADQYNTMKGNLRKISDKTQNYMEAIRKSAPAHNGNILNRFILGAVDLLSGGNLKERFRKESQQEYIEDKMRELRKHLGAELSPLEKELRAVERHPYEEDGKDFEPWYGSGKIFGNRIGWGHGGQTPQDQLDDDEQYWDKRYVDSNYSLPRRIAYSPSFNFSGMKLTPEQSELIDSARRHAARCSKNYSLGFFDRVFGIKQKPLVSGGRYHVSPEDVQYLNDKMWMERGVSVNGYGPMYQIGLMTDGTVRTPQQAVPSMGLSRAGDMFGAAGSRVGSAMALSMAKDMNMNVDPRVMSQAGAIGGDQIGRYVAQHLLHKIRVPGAATASKGYGDYVRESDARYELGKDYELPDPSELEYLNRKMLYERNGSPYVSSILANPPRSMTEAVGNLVNTYLGERQFKAERAARRRQGMPS